jgi:hypothetical protein
MKKSLLLLITFISFNAFAQTTCTNNILQNPGYENSLTNWDGNGGQISTVAATGTKSLKLCQGSNILQSIPTVAGKTFTLTFKARGEVGNSNALSYIKYLSNAWQPIVTEFFDYQTTAVYGQGSVTKLSPANTAYIEIGFRKETAGCVLIDDVCLSENGANPCDNDVIAPVFTNCPINLNYTTTTTCAVASWTAAPIATDNCGTPTVSQTAGPASGSCFPVGITPVTYTATDAKGNVAICTFTVTVTSNVNPCTNDIIPPVFGSCPTNINLTTTTTCANATWSVPTATDNCGNPSITQTSGLALGACFPLGTTLVSYTATDAKGNKVTCSFNVIVTQTVTGSNFCTSPSTNVKDGGGSILVSGLTSSCSYISVFTSGWASISSNQYNGTSVTIPNITPGNYIVKVKVLGTGCTWPTLCESDVNVTLTSGTNPCTNDIVPPVLSACPANINLTTTTSSIVATWTPPTATDNCGTPTVSANFNSGTNFIIGTTTVIYTATDGKANKSTCSFNVTVTGTTGGACSFIKTYTPLPLINIANATKYNFGYHNIDKNQQLNISATGMSTWFSTINDSYTASTIKTINTDLDGNLINIVTAYVNDAYSTGNTIQTNTSDLVHISIVNSKPVFNKINSAGTTIWTSTISQYNSGITSSYPPFPYAIIPDGSGFIVAIGNYDYTTSTSEMTFIKIDANGTFQWQKAHIGTFTNLNVLGTSSTAIFVSMNTTTGYTISKIDKSNGNILWTTLPYSLNSYDKTISCSTVTSDGNLVLALRQYTSTVLQKYNAQTGAIILDNLSIDGTTAGLNTSIIGMYPTTDGGIIANGSTNIGLSTQVTKIYKLTSSLTPVWNKTLPTNWNFVPKNITSDGSIIFVGIKGNDYAIMKTNSVGDLTPLCSNSCYVSNVTFSNITCNNNGTDTEPLDDTYSYDVLVTQNGSCPTGGLTTWTGDGTSGFFGVVRTITGKKINDGEVLVSFSDASNPLSTINTQYINPPAFCSNTGIGCGYDKIVNGYVAAIADSFGFKANYLPNGNIALTGQYFGYNAIDNRSRDLVIDGTGTTISTKYEVVRKGTRTLDSYFISGTYSNNTLTVNKTNADSTVVLFNKAVAYIPGQSPLYSAPIVNKIVPVSDGYVFALSYNFQTTPNTAPIVVYSFVKTDLNGNKIYSFDSKNYTNAPDYIRDLMVGKNGDLYLLRSTQTTIYLDKYNTSGVFQWSQWALGDFPSSSFTDMREGADGNIYMTRLDNNFGYIRKLDAITGNQLWQFSSSQLPIPNNSTIFGYPKGTMATADGGVIFSMGISIPGSTTNGSGAVLGRLSKNGQVIWYKTISGIYNLRPVLNTTDGGYLFVGNNTGQFNGSNSLTDFVIYKTNSRGEITPTCGVTNGNQPDLTLTNLNVTNTSVAAGSIANFKFDLKNIGTGNATGTFNVKSYLSKDNVLSADDIQDGSVPTGNLLAGQTVTQVGGAMTVPANTLAGSYYIIVKADADNQITESNENNNVIVSTMPITVTTTTGGNKPDLSLTLTASPQNPGQWKTSVLTLTLTNSGTVAATGVKVDIMNQSNTQVSSILAYQSFVAPAGTTYDSWIGVWTIPTINPGQSLVFTYNSFTKLATSIPVFAQVKTQSPADADSNPGNNTTNLPAEDDEALVILNANNPVAPSSASRADKSLDWYNGDKETNVQLYPNPTEGILNIYINSEYFKTSEFDTNADRNAKIMVYNTYGIEILRKEIENCKDVEQLELNDIPSGSYYVRVEIPNKKPLVQKLTVLK